MLIRPIQTEKSYREQTKSSYMFIVPTGVTVVSVRTLVRDGKKTKFSRGKHAYPGTTFRQDKKYAFVTLKAGDKIKVFDEEPVVEENKDAAAGKKGDK